MEQKKIKYRKARIEDGYEWYKLLDDVWRVAYSHIFPEKLFEVRESAIDERAKGFTEEKFLGDRKIAYVAEAGGKIVALMFGVLDSNYEYFKNNYADLVGLYVRPEYQGMGVGTMLKDIFTHWAKENKADQFVIGVLKDNSKARKVYESWGGTLSEHEHEFKQMGVGYPEVFYTYEI